MLALCHAEINMDTYVKEATKVIPGRPTGTTIWSGASGSKGISALAGGAGVVVGMAANLLLDAVFSHGKYTPPPPTGKDLWSMLDCYAQTYTDKQVRWGIDYA